MKTDINRRNFLLRAGSGVSAILLSAHWPSIASAAEHARDAARSDAPKLVFFTADEAKEIDAITARIIPADDMPGAHEAGAVYFIDKALTTFASDDQKTYRGGLVDLQGRVREAFPAIAKFSEASPDQQDQVLRSFEAQPDPNGRRPFRPRIAAQNFFEVIRVHTIIAFVIDPDASEFGNRDGVGWRVIGREREHMFQPPFGFYDKDYPGWEASMKEADKNKS